jgi:hypothetical protein
MKRFPSLALPSAGSWVELGVSPSQPADPRAPQGVGVTVPCLVVQTRTLLILAAVTGLAILLASAVFLFRVSSGTERNERQNGPQSEQQTEQQSQPKLVINSTSVPAQGN